jgi:hypothetical protein
MKLLNMKSAAAAALIGVAAMAMHSQAWAETKDYEFQLVQPQIKKGDSAVVAVRLVDKRSGKAVSGAVIFTQRVDMAPEGMETMSSPIERLPSTEPGIYRFKTNLTMEGGWRLSVAAKVQGESGTVEGKLPFKAVP